MKNDDNVQYRTEVQEYFTNSVLQSIKTTNRKKGLSKSLGLTLDKYFIFLY